MNREECLKIYDDARNKVEIPYLCVANLRDTDLSGADLNRAELGGADLSDAIGLGALGPIGSRKGILYYVLHPNCVMIQTGCFWDTLDNFASAVEAKHGNNVHGQIYHAAIGFIRVWEKLERNHDEYLPNCR